MSATPLSSPHFDGEAAPAVVHEDDLLMVRIQDGDETAFSQLMQKYERELLGFFRKNIRDEHLAEDLCQDTLLKLHNQAWDYLPRGKFRSWLYRVARNLLIDDVRRGNSDALIRSYRGQAEDDYDPLTALAAESVAAHQVVDQRELVDLVDELLGTLPEEQRTCFTLHHYSGLSLPEVAEVMDANVPTTKSRWRLAREKLCDLLRQRGYDPVLDDEE